MSEESIKARRVPPGWIAPGPAGCDRVVDLGPDEEVSWLLGDWRIVQRRDGHRWSLDDFVTAWVAREAWSVRKTRPPPTVLDLGSGIGSVALMLAWCFPEAHVTGVEAQAVSHALSLKSRFLNALEDRVTFTYGDLRQLAAGSYDLVTGTPPYFDDPAQTRSRAVQKEPCRFETRGGVGDYLAAIERTLAPAGIAVVCHASRHRARVVAAIEASTLYAIDAVEVVPKVARPPLVDVLVLARGAAPCVWRRLVVRDHADQWTAEFVAVRLAMGMPPRP